MKNRVPDLERCKRLREAGFPQGKTLFIHVRWAASGLWTTEYRDAMYERKLEDDRIIREWIAAPLVTELVEEIAKLIIDVLPEDYVGIELNFHKDGTWDAWAFLFNTHTADTLPNALADLWLELKGENHERK